MKKTSFNFKLIMFFGFATYTLMTTQIVPFLTQLGFTPTQRGYVLSMMSLTSILGQMLLGYISDKTKTMRNLFIYLSMMVVASGFLAYFVQADYFVYYLFILGIGAGMTRTALNFLEAWVMEVDGLQSEFGGIRAFGSLGWALFSLLSGFLITRWGYPAIALVVGVFTFVVIVIASQTQEASKTHHTKVTFKEVGTLFKNKNFVLLIVIYLLAYISYNADNITLTDYMISLGADESLLGIRWFISAVTEIPTMIIGYRIIRRKGGPWMMAVASLVLMMKLTLSAFVGNNIFIIALSGVQMFCYPFLLLSQKDLVYKEIPKHLRSTGQLVSISLSIGLGGALTPILSGVLVERFGIQTSLYLFAGLMIVPLFLITRLRRPNDEFDVNLV